MSYIMTITKIDQILTEMIYVSVFKLVNRPSLVNIKFMNAFAQIIQNNTPQNVKDTKAVLYVTVDTI